MVVPDGSDLCRGCGICCTGIFFLKVAITPEEAITVTQAGINVMREEEKHVFELPCRAHLDKLCTIYSIRPGICQAYTCKLLERYLRGDVSLETAQQHTTALVDLYGRALALVSSGDDRFVWKLVHTKLGDEEFREVVGVSPELGEVIDRLRVLIYEEFSRKKAEA
jgi:hypothetical protein